MLKALSMRVSRSTAGIPASPQHITKASSEPGNLETAYSDDSSVFSGLPSLQSPRDHADILQQDSSDRSGLNSILSGRKSTTSVRFDDERQTDTQRSRHTCVGKYKMKAVSTAESESEEERTAFISIMRSGSATGSEKSYLRDMKAVADVDSAFDMERTEETSLYPGTYTNVSEYQDLDDNDASTMSYGSVHGLQRPRGRMNFVSEMKFLNQEDVPAETRIEQEELERQDPALESRSGAPSPCSEDSEQELSPNGNETRITEMLQEYEKQMDANLILIKSEDHGSSYLSELQDVIPRRVKSVDEAQVLTQNQSRQLRRILNQARTEVEVLKDNNEQFMSEIEQMEEENLSEKKLVEERYKQKISELKAMYQEEIESVIKEKDAAIVEASRQTSKCLDSGRKQISTLKIQIEKLKAQATGLTKQSVDEAVEAMRKKKDEEMTARLGALRKSYEGQLEREKLEREKQAQLQMSEAVSSVTQRLLTDRDREVKEKEAFLRQQFEVEKKSTVKAATFAYQQEVINLRIERDAVLKALESVKDNVHSRYPEEIAEMQEKSAQTSGALQLIQSQDHGPKSQVEKLFKEVIEAFAFIMDASENKIASATYLANVEETKKERNEVYAKARKELILRHRAELEHSKRQQEDSKDKIFRLEESLKNLGREKRFLEDKYRRAVESHRLEVQKARSEQDALLNMEKGRKELATAMAKSEAELAFSAAAVGRRHFLKSTQDSDQTKATETNGVDVNLQANEQDSSQLKEMKTVEHSRTEATSKVESQSERHETSRGSYSHLPEGLRRLRRRHLDRKEDSESSKPREDACNEVTKPKSVNDPPSRADLYKGASSARNDPEESGGTSKDATEGKLKNGKLEKRKETTDVKMAKSESSSYSYRGLRSIDLHKSTNDERCDPEESPRIAGRDATEDKHKTSAFEKFKESTEVKTAKPESWSHSYRSRRSIDLNKGTSSARYDPEESGDAAADTTEGQQRSESTKSESSSHSYRSKRSVLVKVRKQTKEKSDTTTTTAADEAPRPEPTGAKDNGPKDSMKQKSFAILRSFKAARENANQRDPVASTQGKDPEGTTEHSRRARKFRSLFDTLKSEDSSRARESLAEESLSSLSSLQADTGATEPPSPKVVQSPRSDHSIRRRRRTVLAEARNAPSHARSENPADEASAREERSMGDVIDENKPASQDEAPKGTVKNRNPLGMFTNSNSDVEDKDDASNEVEDRATPQTLRTEVNSNSANGMGEDGIPAPPEQSTAKNQGEANNTLKFKKTAPPTDGAWNRSCVSDNPKGDKHVDPSQIDEKDNAPLGEITNPMRNLKKPSRLGFLSNGGGKSPPPPHVINGKKPPLPDWMGAMNDPSQQPRNVDTIVGFALGGSEAVPETIALRPSAKKQFVTPAAEGHTMCLRPLPVENAKHNTVENVSGLSADSNGFVSTGVTSETATSSDDDDCLKYDTASQLRNFPPLGDDESDEDSGSDSDAADRYTSLEPPVQFAQDYSRTERTGKCVPLVISRSVDESPVLYMDSNESKPIVVQGRPIYRQPELSAFSPRHDASETSSELTTERTGKCVPSVSRRIDDSPVLYMDSNDSKPIVVQGRSIYRQKESSAFSPRHDASETSSEATTAITAHTFRSSLQTEPKKKLPKSPRELLRSNLPPPPPEGGPPRRAGNFLSFKRRTLRAEI